MDLFLILKMPVAILSGHFEKQNKMGLLLPIFQKGITTHKDVYRVPTRESEGRGRGGGGSKDIFFYTFHNIFLLNFISFTCK